MKTKIVLFMALALTLARGAFAISPKHADNFKPIIDAALRGENVSHFFVDDEENPAPTCSLFTANGDLIRGFDFSKEEAPKGSVGILNISGPIMKEDYCGSLGTTTMQRLFKQIHYNKGIGATVFTHDSPGGSVAGTPQFADLIYTANRVKPVISHIQDLSASADYWLAAAAKKVYISSLSDEVGSIGVYCRVRNADKAMKKRGIIEFEVYAPQSTEKNAPYNEAAAGNTAKLETELGIHAGNFINSIKQYRGDKIKSEDVFKGGIYIGKAAVDVGLADGIKTFDEVLKYAHQLANTRTVKYVG